MGWEGSNTVGLREQPIAALGPHPDTRKHTSRSKTELYDFIMDFYEERSVVVGRDEAGEEKTELKRCIKRDRNTKQLESLAQAFEAIGYFKMGDVLLGTATDAVGKARDKLSGLFS